MCAISINIHPFQVPISIHSQLYHPQTLTFTSMGQIETKIFHEVPSKYLKFSDNNTDLDHETVQICWTFWRSDHRFNFTFVVAEVL